MADTEKDELPDGFATTQWSLVLAARGPDADRVALERLCRVYWRPVFIFARRSGFGPEDAEDLTQSFFADILQRDWLERADPERGRFRGFLRASMGRFVQQYRRVAGAEKRGGKLERVDLAEVERAEAQHLATPEQLGPDEAFDRGWAQAVLDRAMERLVAEQEDARRRALFTACRPFLLQPAEGGDYAAIAARFGIARGTVAVTVYRLGKRYRELVRAEVAETVDRPEKVDTELRHLLAVVSN